MCVCVCERERERERQKRERLEGEKLEIGARRTKDKQRYKSCSVERWATLLNVYG